jgi:hypothetical protein
LLASATPILEVSPANVPDSVIAQCKLNCETDDTNSKTSEDEAYKKSISDEIRQRKREKKLQHESVKNQAQNLSSTDQAPLSRSEISIYLAQVLLHQLSRK